MKHFLLAISLFLWATGLPAQKQNSYPVVASFNSMCCGVPKNAPVKKMVIAFKKQHKIKRVLVDSIGPMGREGEYYLAFRLKELTRSQKLKFIRELKRIAPAMKEQGSVSVEENMLINKADLSSRATITVLKW